MNWFLEGPWPILATGLILEAVLVVALLHTGRAAILWGILGVGVVTAGMLVLERQIVTDNEQIRQTLDGVAAAAEANNLDGILAYVAPEAEPVRRLAADSLRRATIREARVLGDLAIRITQQGAEPSALATFTGRFRVEEARAALRHEMIVVRLRAGLVKRDGRWLVVAIEQRDGQHH